MDDENHKRHVIEGFKVICLCRSVKKNSILKAIKEGCVTVDAINKKLRTGSGDCQGERCQHKIKQIVNELT